MLNTGLQRNINLSHWANELYQCLLYGHVVISMLDIHSKGLLYTEVCRCIYIMSCFIWISYFLICDSYWNLG